MLMLNIPACHRKLPFALAAGFELKTSNVTQMDTERYLLRSEETVKQHIYIEEMMLFPKQECIRRWAKGEAIVADNTQI